MAALSGGSDFKAAMIEASQLSYGHSINTALQKNLSFTLMGGEALLVEGENGSGKSLLAKVLANLHPHQGGLKNSFRKVRYLPQISNPKVSLPFTLGEVAGDRIKMLSEDQVNLPWNSASGGERQRALIDRTFHDSADLYILDEPLNHIDHSTRSALKLFLNEYFKKQNSALVLISHEAGTQDWLSMPIKKIHLKRAPE